MKKNTVVPSMRSGTFVCVVFLCASCAQANAQEKIPLLISEHHADHGLWFFSRVAAPSHLILVDAHSDVARSGAAQEIRARLDAGDVPSADSLLSNHDWIHPLTPFPVSSLVWIPSIIGRNLPRGAENYMAYKSRDWGIEADCVSLEDLLRSDELPAEVKTRRPSGETLLISIDLDFFYQANYSPRDIPSVFDALMEYSIQSGQKTLWAVCLSYPWMPHDYAMETLEAALQWFSERDCFEAPEVTLFTSTRRDQSNTARTYRVKGSEPPSLYGKEDSVPLSVKKLLDTIQH